MSFPPTPRTVILVGPYQFNVRAPFAAGHVLTADEASAYNEFRAKGIVWNVREYVNTAIIGARLDDGELLDDATLRELQKKIDIFDKGYRHPVERGSRKNKTIEPKRGVIEQEAYDIAGRQIEEYLRQGGFKMSPEDFERARIDRAGGHVTRDLARQALRQKRQILERAGI